ncbi:MAG: DNA/RNA nuclease SfsA [Pseudomonas fluorescens]|nr:MAG: DNA/RNA nuclease SfsA [Pseudomonas fluorescens]
MDKAFTFEFGTPLVRWDFKGREKRFFIYGLLDGQVAHCANTGSMLGLIPEAKGVWVTPYPPESGRKLLFGAEMMEMPDGTLVGINTMLPNKLAEGAIKAGLVPEVSGELKREVKFDAHTRFDLKVGETWIEVKNVTLGYDGVAVFPDAKTERGAKHLRELQGIVEAGGKALQIFMVQRGDCTTFRPADEIDPVYAATLRSAVKAGVQAIALGCSLTETGIKVDRRLQIVL